MVCKQCNEDYEAQFDEDFVNGICLPCQTENDAEAWDIQRKAELEMYYSRTDFNLDINEFCCFAEAGEVNRANLVGLPGLQEMYDYEMENLNGYQFEEWQRSNRQLELFQNEPLIF